MPKSLISMVDRAVDYSKFLTEQKFIEREEDNGWFLISVVVVVPSGNTRLQPVFRYFFRKLAQDII